MAGIVAPRVGAWIETLAIATSTAAKSSHPVWVRGLKRLRVYRGCSVEEVAPRVGAWIETNSGK